jgi:hypothetical protein
MRRSREDKVSVGFVDDEGNIVSLGKIGKSSNETRRVYSTGLGIRIQDLLGKKRRYDVKNDPQGYSESRARSLLF